MNNKKNFIFISSYFNQNIVLQVISEAILRNTINLWIINTSDGSLLKLTSKDLNDIRRDFPRSTSVYTKNPEDSANRLTCFSDWQEVSLNDLLITEKDKIFIQNMMGKEDKKITINDLESKMKLYDSWSKNDFAEVLAFYNTDIGDETFFRELIYSAIEARILTSISSQIDYTTDPKKRNLIFRPNDLITWAISKNLNIGFLVNNPGNADTPLTGKRPPSTKERYSRYQQEANRILAELKNKPTKDNLAQMVLDHLKASAPEFVIGTNNNFYSVNTILKNIRMA